MQQFHCTSYNNNIKSIASLLISYHILVLHSSAIIELVQDASYRTKNPSTL